MTDVGFPKNQIHCLIYGKGITMFETLTCLISSTMIVKIQKYKVTSTLLRPPRVWDESNRGKYIVMTYAYNRINITYATW